MLSIVISPSALLLAAAGITLEGKNSLNSLHVFDYACQHTGVRAVSKRERDKIKETYGGNSSSEYKRSEK